jgi:16S rRNA (uracil1498-N3)-methyltransferase
MARRRFFVDSVRSGRAEIQGEDARHLTKVLRVEPWQRYEISDDTAAYLAEVALARKEQVVFAVLEKLPPEPPSPEIAVFAALIKFDAFELLIEKATELGVTSITPVAATRSERGLDLAAPKRLERWRKIALEASQQSRRDHLPRIADPLPLSACLAAASGQRLCLDEAGGQPLLRVYDPALPASLLAGPEGGWTDAERERIARAGWTPVTLGPRILRAETAVIAALAVLDAAFRLRQST